MNVQYIKLENIKDNMKFGLKQELFLENTVEPLL